MSIVGKISITLIAFYWMIAARTAFADMLPLPAPHPVPWASEYILRIIVVALTVAVVLAFGRFLRYYNGDDREQNEAAAEIFARARRGEIDLFCGPLVFFEVAWVLKSRYKLLDKTVLDILEAMLYIPNMRVSDDERVMRAIVLARESAQSFADAYIAVTAQNEDLGVASFNRRHFEKLGAPLYSL